MVPLKYLKEDILKFAIVWFIGEPEVAGVHEVVNKALIEPRTEISYLGAHLQLLDKLHLVGQLGLR